MASWKTIIPSSMRICPIIGEIESNKADEIQRFRSIMDFNSITEIHFYTYTDDVPSENWDALRNLGQSPLVA
jgi:hypothetical protein